jgi:hypothetical protein
VDPAVCGVNVWRIETAFALRDFSRMKLAFKSVYFFFFFFYWLSQPTCGF